MYHDFLFLHAYVDHCFMIKYIFVQHVAFGMFTLATCKDMSFTKTKWILYSQGK